MNYLQKEIADRFGKTDEMFSFLNTFSWDGMWYRDLEQPDNEWISEKMWQKLGYAYRAEQQKVRAWEGLVPPGDLMHFRAYMQKLGDNPPETVDLIVRFLHKDGRTIWMQKRGKLIRDADGRAIRFFGTFHDITRLKTNQDLLYQTAQAARIGSWQLYPQEGKIVWDSIVRDIHEVPSDYVPDLETAVKFYKEGESREKVQKYVQRAIDEGIGWDFEHQLVTAKGRVIWVRAMGRVEKTDGQVTCIYGLVQDIDRLVRAERALRDNSVLRSKSKQLEDFAYIASHDLREPLRTLLSFTELLTREYMNDEDAEVREIAKYITDAASRMDAMVQGLLDYSRLTHQNPYERADMQKITEEVLTDLKVSIEEKNATIIFSDLPTVNGYPSELKRLMQNFISNGIKFHEPGARPVVKITAKEIRRGWLFSVEDNGIGIPAKSRQDIFKLFKRLHGRSKYQGTGIGLAVCQRIVELHRGRIEVYSEPGEFTRFEFGIKTKERKLNER